MSSAPLQRKDSSSLKPHAAVLLAGCMWGSVGIFVRLLDGLGYSPLTIVFVRSIVSFTILFIALLIFNKALLRIKIKDLWVFIGTALTSAIALNLLFNISTIMNSLALAAVLLTTAPFFVIVFAAFAFKEKITSMKIAALLLVFAGCVLTSGLIGSGSAFSGFDFNPIGVLIGVLSGVGYALYTIFSRLALNRGYDSLTINVYSFGIGALCCIPFADFTVITGSIYMQPAYMSLLLVTHALFASLLPYVLFTYGMNYMDTGKAAIIVSIEPVSAAIFGAVLYREIPSAISVIGIALVILAIALLNLPQSFRSLFPRGTNSKGNTR